MLPTTISRAGQPTRQIGPTTGMNWGVYQRFFFDTNEEDSRICESANPEADGDASALDANAIPELLEERLPFYSESSVRLGEMVHDRAADHSWSWRHRGSDIIFCAQSNAVMPFRSTFPPIFSDLPFDELITDRVAGLVLLVIVALAIRWFVRFTLHKVFAIDVIEPFWSGARTLDPCHGRTCFSSTTAGFAAAAGANYYQVDWPAARRTIRPPAPRGSATSSIASRNRSAQNVLVRISSTGRRIRIHRTEGRAARTRDGGAAPHGRRRVGAAPGRLRWHAGGHSRRGCAQPRHPPGRRGGRN